MQLEKVYVRAARSHHYLVLPSRKSTRKAKFHRNLNGSRTPAPATDPSIPSVQPYRHSARSSKRNVPPLAVTPSPPKPRHFALAHVTPPPHLLPSTPYGLRRAPWQRGGTRLHPDVVALDWHENQKPAAFTLCQVQGARTPLHRPQVRPRPRAPRPEFGERHIL
jgi:hypothetical protein